MLKHIAWPPGIRVRCPANRWSVVAAHYCRQVAHLCDAAALDISPITRVAGARIGRYLSGMPCHVMSCQYYAMPCHAMPCGKGTRSVDMVCMDNEQRTKGTYSGAGEIPSVHTFPARACVLAGLRPWNEWAEGSPMRLCLRRHGIKLGLGVGVGVGGGQFLPIGVGFSAWQGGAGFASKCGVPLVSFSPTPRRALDTRTRQWRMPKRNCAHDTVAIIEVRSSRSLGRPFVGG
jgi:hypothetical protein